MVQIGCEMKPILLIAALACLIGCQRAEPPAIAETIQTGSDQPAVAAAPSGATLTPEDIVFVRTVLSEGMGEVELATAVRSHSRNAEVRGLATEVIDDLNRIDAELANVAYARSFPLDGGAAPDLEAAKQSVLSDTGQIDRRYLDTLVASYGDLLARYTSAAQNASDGDLRRIAAPAALKLQQHVQRARSLRQTLT